MNHQQRLKIIETWLALAQMYGKDIPQQTMTLMVNAVSDLDPKKVETVLNEWSANSKLGRHPFPIEVREKIFPPQSEPKDLARETALKIRQAVTKFGWANPEEAKAFIGEAGWVVVGRFGGWAHICTNLGTEIQETTFIAQCRDAVESQIKLGNSGLDLAKPVIEQANDKKRISVLDLALKGKDLNAAIDLRKAIEGTERAMKNVEDLEKEKE